MVARLCPVSIASTPIAKVYIQQKRITYSQPAADVVHWSSICAFVDKCSLANICHGVPKHRLQKQTVQTVENSTTDLALTCSWCCTGQHMHHSHQPLHKTSVSLSVICVQSQLNFVTVKQQSSDNAVVLDGIHRSALRNDGAYGAVLQLCTRIGKISFLPFI